VRHKPQRSERYRFESRFGFGVSGLQRVKFTAQLFSQHQTKVSTIEINK
jgi:hypothetical protein